MRGRGREEKRGTGGKRKEVGLEVGKEEGDSKEELERRESWRENEKVSGNNGKSFHLGESSSRDRE